MLLVKLLWERRERKMFTHAHQGKAFSAPQIPQDPDLAIRPVPPALRLRATALTSLQRRAQTPGQPAGASPGHREPLTHRLSLPTRV